MKVQEYITTEIVMYGLDWHDQKQLPKGTFVKPISYNYVPKHVIEKWIWINRSKEVFCYTPVGIIPIPLKSIREV